MSYERWYRTQIVYGQSMMDDPLFEERVESGDGKDPDMDFRRVMELRFTHVTKVFTTTQGNTRYVRVSQRVTLVSSRTVPTTTPRSVETVL